PLPTRNLKFGLRVPWRLTISLMNDSLRVAVVTESFLPQVNGVTNSVLRVLETLAAKGHDALVIAPDSAEAPTTYAGFRVKRVPSLAVKGLLPVGFPQRSMEPLIEGFNPDVIHLASPFFLGKYATRIAQRLSIPTLSIYQTDVAGFARHYGLSIAHNKLTNWVANIHNQTDRTLAPSTWSCEQLQSSGVSNVSLWQRGVDSVKFNPTKRSAELRNSFTANDTSKIIVGYVGRLANEKKIEDLAPLHDRDDVQLVIVGDGPARQKLERALPRARFVGYQSGEDLAAHYASFDIFVHTGKHETFCQSIQESLASGVPVIAPNSGGPLDLVQHGATGFLLDTSNSSDLIAAFELLTDARTRSLMGSTARESVTHRTWEKVNNQLIDHYRDLSTVASNAREENVA
ncbi:MAG: glycosyltransferase family 1 protein, partial [Actinomycetes bacterium]